MIESRDVIVEDLKSFLRTIQRPGRAIEVVGEDEGLVSSGFMDSLAIVQIVSYLETRHRVDFAAIGLDPDRLSTVSSIIDLILESKQ